MWSFVSDSEHGRAAALLDEALASASELGMRPLTECILSRRPILIAYGDPAGFTREGRVVQGAQLSGGISHRPRSDFQHARGP